MLRRLPVHPRLALLEDEAAALVATGGPITLDEAKALLARDYGAADWSRLELACRLVDAIWSDDLETVQKLMREHPGLLHEDALVRESNWGRPMSYAANLGRDRIIAFLHEIGATDHEFALDRAALQGQVGTARLLHGLAGRPRPGPGALGGAAYTLSATGTAFLLELGAAVVDPDGRGIAPVNVVLESDSRDPVAKHAILEMYAERGFPMPDTPMVALHRGRIDLLEAHLGRDPDLLRRTFTFSEIFPPGLGCQGEEFPRTPLEGATLLHVCVEFGEMEVARWLLSRGMDADVPASVDTEGYGGHTALFTAVVCYANFWHNFRGTPGDAAWARLLLDHGADPNHRASLRARYVVNYQADGLPGTTEALDVTPIGWGRTFGYRMVVNEAAMQLIEERGGHG
jgi:hypothetical protein